MIYIYLSIYNTYTNVLLITNLLVSIPILIRLMENFDLLVYLRLFLHTNTYLSLAG